LIDLILIKYQLFMEPLLLEGDENTDRAKAKEY
jgi:hypothetical protein